MLKCLDVQSTVYNNTNFAIGSVPRHFVTQMPAVEGMFHDGLFSSKVPYTKSDIYEAFSKLLSAGFASPSLERVQAYHYDLTDCTRQLMDTVAQEVYLKVSEIVPSCPIFASSWLTTRYCFFS